MRCFEHQEGTQWLGGEAQVYPFLPKRQSASLTHLISRSMLLLAGAILGRLAAIGEIRQKYGLECDQVRNVEGRTSSERSGTMEQRRAEEGLEGDRGVGAVGIVTIVAAFGIGLVAGAVTTLLTTPESGTCVRNRIKRGMDTARKEFDEGIDEAKEDWNMVEHDIREAAKRTVSRVRRVAEVTKDAVTSGDAFARREP